MNVTAKFRCSEVSVVRVEGGYAPTRVKLYAADGPGNEQWSKATPSGGIEMSITNEAAAAVFEPGKHYLLTFTQEP